MPDREHEEDRERDEDAHREHEAKSRTRALALASLDETQLDGGPILRDFLDTARARKER